MPSREQTDKRLNVFTAGRNNETWEHTPEEEEGSKKGSNRENRMLRMLMRVEIK